MLYDWKAARLIRQVHLLIHNKVRTRSGRNQKYDDLNAILMHPSCNN